MVTRLVIIGIGGASCSGKTLLAKHLRRILPRGAAIVHQDDFAPSSDEVPYSPEYPEWQDWDDPPTCIKWPDFRQALQHIRQTGNLPASYESNDHLNKQVEIAVDEDRLRLWRSRFQELVTDYEHRGEQIVWVLVDGFVLYWDAEVTDALDIRLLLRIPKQTLSRRRENRQTYVLSNPKDAADGGVWVDPPEYFPKIVWPAYVKAHEHIFGDQDVENGSVTPTWRERLTLLEPEDGTTGMTAAFDQACDTIFRSILNGAGSKLMH